MHTVSHQIMTHCSAVSQWLEKCWYTVLPPLCVPCGGMGTGSRNLCEGCAADLPRNHTACAQCAAPIRPDQTSVLCRQCYEHPPLFDRAFVPFLYRTPIDTLIKQLKFAGQLSLGRLLGDLFSEALIARGGPWPDYIVPVPLHNRRLRQRGFNQARELVRISAQRCGLTVSLDDLRRTRETRAQAELMANDRFDNVQGAFTLKTTALRGKHIALFDDVVTTTSTVAECAYVLRAGGVREIELWAIARAGYHPR